MGTTDKRTLYTGSKNPNWSGGRFRKCQLCRTPFWMQPKSFKTAKYCSLKCKYTGGRTQFKSQCANCSKQIKCFNYTRKHKHHFCSNPCKFKYLSGPNHSAWKGRMIGSNGYALIYIRPQGRKRKYIEEHRLVMEGVMGRRLRTNEVVHHLNQNKLDNRPENLMLLTNLQHLRLHAKMRSHV